MRHLRQVSNDCFTVNIFAERERNFRVRFCFFPTGRLQHFAQFHGDFAGIRQLDADRVFTGNRRENIDPLGACRASEVSLQAHNLVHTHALCRIHFVARDRRSLGDVSRRDGNAELRQRINQDLPHLL